MEQTSQVILRNLGQLPAGPALLVNAPRDALDASLAPARVNPRHSCQDFAAYRWFREGGRDAAFEAVPDLRGDESLVILHLPREKERLAMLLHALASRLPAAACLWLVGENREGIKSALPQLKRRFARVNVIDKARHCVLYRAEAPLSPGEDFNLEAYEQWWNMVHAGREVQLCSLPGVFAHGRLDAGSALLLQSLQGIHPEGRVLDFACGSGVIGLALGAAGHAELTLLDASALALASAERSLQRNGLSGHLLPSDGCSELHGSYDWIVSNPPFHRGVRNDLEVAAAFFREAANFLGESGKMAVVFNRHLPYVRWMRESLAAVEVMADDGSYLVVSARAPRKRSNRGRRDG
jgi:16S rRNA (guanine1207-N2)-methyltransferase